MALQALFDQAALEGLDGLAQSGGRGRGRRERRGAERARVVIPAPRHRVGAGQAETLGSIRAQNIVLLGALVRALELEAVDWKALIAKYVPLKALEMNLRAFEAGYNM